VGDAPKPLHPPGWPRASGYTHGVAAGGMTVVASGQVGWDPQTGIFASDDLAAQVGQALENVVAVLRAGGAEPRHLVRLTWYVTDKGAYLAARREIGEVYREVLGNHYPAMTLVVVAGLLEDRARVEIEATAIVPG
jgi:enamine deaminase RidA (YjgF/YER057c/UK114 family)